MKIYYFLTGPGSGLFSIYYITKQLYDLVILCDILDFMFLICKDQVFLGEVMEWIRQVKREIKVMLWQLLSVWSGTIM